VHSSISDERLFELLDKSRTIAVVGLSGKPERDSFKVAQYMQKQGYKIIPINPKVERVLGEKAYPDLPSVPEPVDIVNIFRRSEHILPVVNEALKISPLAIWMQLGIVNEEAAEIAEKAGILVIMDKCIMVEHRRLKG